ncbi:hypothetical protein [Paenibacillus cellulositrophicus]|uniref:hypothetical protein n=1 Tax=Paenibacillus cellulositrophicus TaxID=562959 RepID=UPI0012677A60|nr:hypothetical protein [Paenibacillus cellulositrophicus]
MQYSVNGMTFINILGTEVDNIPVSTGTIIKVRYSGTSTQNPSESQVLQVTDDVIGHNHYTGEEALAFVKPQDFGVMQFSGVNGYNVGFELVTTTAKNLKKVEVSLYKEDTLLQKNVSNTLLEEYPDATQLSSPFDVTGKVWSGNWENEAWNGTAADVPTRAVIVVTDLEGNTYTVENKNLTGNPASLIPKDYTGADALEFVKPQDFGVMQFSGVNGYSVGFELQKVKAGELKKVVVSLYRDKTLLQKNVSNTLLKDYPDATQLSSPFDVTGKVWDGNWTNEAWNGKPGDVPTKAVIVVTDWMGNTYTVENTSLTGDPELLDPTQYTGEEALAFVKPQDFGVMQFSGVNGYNVGFELQKVTAKDIKLVEVSLFKNDVLLQKNVSNTLLTEYPNATQLSSPFDVTGKVWSGNWKNEAWNGTPEDAPTRAVIVVTDLKGNTYKVESSNPTGDPTALIPKKYTGNEALAFVKPQDFGVMQFSGVNGYSVGFELQTVKAGELKKVEVSLYKDGTLLQRNVSKTLLKEYPEATQLSSPFDVNGSVVDDNWTYGAWIGTSGDVPTKAVIVVTDWMGNTYTVENTSLTGDPSVLIPATSPKDNPSSPIGTSNEEDPNKNFDPTEFNGEPTV